MQWSAVEWSAAQWSAEASCKGLVWFGLRSKETFLFLFLLDPRVRPGTFLRAGFTFGVRRRTPSRVQQSAWPARMRRTLDSLRGEEKRREQAS